MKISTGADVLDTFLEGGYEPAVLTTIYGASGSGKTTTCLLASISGARRGKVLFIDTEGGFSVERFKQLAPDHEQILPNVMILKPLHFADQQKAINTLHEQLPKNIVMIVCDTITALYRVERGSNNVGLNAELGKQVGKLLELARKHDIPVVMTNQVYADFEKKDMIKGVGGDIITYNSKCLIELVVVSRNIREAHLKKHRSIPEKRVTFTIEPSGFTQAANQ